MSLTATAYYQNGKTYITAKENDPEVFFICSPIVDGDFSKATKEELIALTMNWVSNKYTSEYVNIRLTDDVKKINELIKEADEKFIQLEEMANALKQSTVNNEKAINDAVSELTELVMRLMPPDISVQ